MEQLGHFLGREFFARPYRLLPWGVFLYAMLSFALYPDGAVQTGYLGDPDDYMRLNETINWLQGQGWYDLSHPRLSPGEHTVVHWARLLDLPLVLLMLPFIKMMGMQKAAMLASFVVPPLTFALLLVLAAGLARPFVGASRANLATPLVLFVPATLVNFVPGRVDHHGYEVLVAGFGLLCLERMAEDKLRGWLYAIVAAVIFACGLWIGTEALPWVVLFIACLTFMVAWLGGDLPHRAALFGGAFALSSVVVLFLAVPPVEYSSMALSWYSAADVVFAMLVAGMFVGGWAVGLRIWNKYARLASMIVLGLVAAAIFCKLIPNIWRGPFADYNDFDGDFALSKIGEAQPLLSRLQFNPYNHLEILSACLTGLRYLLLPTSGLIALGFVAYRATPRQRPIFLAHGVFLMTAILLTIFWQVRVSWFMQFFGLAPLLYLLLAWWEFLQFYPPGRQRFWIRVFSFIVFDALLVTVLIPAFASATPEMPNIVFFPAERAPLGCPLRPSTDFLMRSPGYGDQKHTILSGTNEGPELLFRTKHDVIGANFNVTGNKDVYSFFGSRDDEVAKKIVQRWHVDLILVCRSFPPAYAQLDHPRLGKNAFLETGPDGRLNLVSDPKHPSLVERLVHGNVPEWLKPIEIPGDKDYLLFEVRL